MINMIVAIKMKPTVMDFSPTEPQYQEDAFLFVIIPSVFLSTLLYTCSGAKIRIVLAMIDGRKGSMKWWVENNVRDNGDADSTAGVLKS